ncbi:MAG: hypothetical protein SV062_13005 [Thermodesulfobacteriota bacterium]|nr:hypothetical protein [Thermodesulfobacteriota bacterium]
MKVTKIFFVFSLFFLLFSFNQNAQAGSMDFNPTVDLVIARPIGLALTAGGLGAFIGLAPLSLIFTRDMEPLANTLVKEPFDYTFKRPLGKQTSITEESGLQEH